MQTSMFETMLQLPLFQGITQAQLTEIIEKIPFTFRRYRVGEQVAREGIHCHEVLFVLRGRVRMYTPNYMNRVVISQEFSGPHTLPIDHLFGPDILENSNIEAVEETGIMMLDKQNLIKMLQSNNIILINVLNMLSTNAQKHDKAMNFSAEPNPTLRMASWILAFTDRSGQKIELHAKISDWCEMLRLTEPEFYNCMSELTSMRIIEGQEGRLNLIDRYALRTYIANKTMQK